MSTLILEPGRLQLTMVVDDNRYFFRWSHGWCLWDVSGKTVKVRNKGLFRENVVVCDVL